ncbi:hypothetical protein [Natronorubrum aibiense]|nr:hypothetical protein [Natronorubrum aibiense]
MTDDLDGADGAVVVMDGYELAILMRNSMRWRRQWSWMVDGSSINGM